ncbi:MAG TPA: adenylosuccinate synthetase, partial [Thermoanaerobaculia bacterium]|nr:adenylosuccinate synthetase [Thermoanaerobaculia bacterium]
MANAIIVGMQWGDEGKGKIVDLICPAFEGVVRFQGGHNAGHTVRFADRHFSLHLIPSGILHPEMLCVLGNG